MSGGSSHRKPRKVDRSRSLKRSTSRPKDVGGIVVGLTDGPSLPSDAELRNDIAPDSLEVTIAKLTIQYDADCRAAMSAHLDRVLKSLGNF